MQAAGVAYEKCKMSTPKRPLKKKQPVPKVEKGKVKCFDFPGEDEKKNLSGSEDDVRAGVERVS